VTPAYQAAFEMTTAYCSRTLLNHSVRPYLRATGYGLERGIAFDAELLCVSALLHAFSRCTLQGTIRIRCASLPTSYSVPQQERSDSRYRAPH